jgi:hypothetical protein
MPMLGVHKSVKWTAFPSLGFVAKSLPQNQSTPKPPFTEALGARNEFEKG